MEFKLEFNEDQIRSIISKFFSDIDSYIGRKTKRHLIYVAGLLISSVASFQLINFNKNWAVFGIVLIIWAIIMSIYSTVHYHRLKRNVKNKRQQYEEWVARYSTLDDIKYSINDNTIDYFENRILTNSFKISDIDNVDISAEHIQMDFGSPDSNIWFPKVCIQDADFNRLLKWAKTIKEQAR